MEAQDFLRAAQNLSRLNPFKLPPGSETACSLPVPVRMEDGTAHGMFLYEAPTVRNPSGNGRPFAWLILDGHGMEPLLFCRAKAESAFFPYVPADGREPFPSPDVSTPEHSRARDELLEQYIRMFEFAFSEDLSGTRRDTAGAYYRLMYALAPTRQMPFYRALSPDFFDWLERAAGQSPTLREPSALPAAATGNSYNMIAQELARLSELFTQKIQTDEHKQRLFDSMHAELQQYKNNLIDTLTRPMEEDIIKLIDDIDRTMELFRSRQFTRDNYRRLLTMFEGAGTDLTDLLYRHGVEPYSQEGDDVVVGRQKVLSAVPTDKQRLDKKVAERHAKGWEKNGKIIRPERVTAYVFRTAEK